MVECKYCGLGFDKKVRGSSVHCGSEECTQKQKDFNAERRRAWHRANWPKLKAKRAAERAKAVKTTPVFRHRCRADEQPDLYPRSPECTGHTGANRFFCLACHGLQGHRGIDEGLVYALDPPKITAEEQRRMDEAVARLGCFNRSEQF